MIAFLEQNYGGLPAVIRQDSNLLNHFLPIIRADLAVVNSYRYYEEAPLSCPITISCGLSDPSTTESQLQDWGHHTTGDFLLKAYPGGHFFPQTHKQLLIEDIARQLEV